MNVTTTRVIGIFTVLASIAVPACKEDPPPPPPVPTTASTATVKPTNAVGTQVQRMSPEATKLFRVDMCFFGSQGLRYLSESYLTSLGGAEPSPTKLPDFGEYPDPRALPRIAPDKDAEKATDAPAKGKETADAKGAQGDKAKGDPRPMRPPASAVRQLPFLKYLRYCAVAKQLKQPAHAELDAAIVAFDQYASTLNRSLVEATRYFGAKQFERDSFKRGKALHAELSEKLPKAGEELDKLQKGVDAFKSGLKPLPDELDASGKIALRAYEEARAATMLFLAEEVDIEAVKVELEKVKKSYDELVAQGEKDTSAPHPKVVAPKIAALVAAMEAAIEGGDAPTSVERYAVFVGMADMVENMQRALAQLLNRRGGGPSVAPGRMLKPRLRPGKLPQRLPRPADEKPAEEKPE